jgi:hypothetical protein
MYTVESQPNDTVRDSRRKTLPKTAAGKRSAKTEAEGLRRTLLEGARVPCAEAEGQCRAVTEAEGQCHAETRAEAIKFLHA